MKVSSGIFWMDGDPAPGLAIVLRPRGGDWLEDELLRMKRDGIEVLVSLLEEDEAWELGLAEERATAAKLGLTFVSSPIPDRHVPPNTSAFRAFVQGLAEHIQAGKRVGVHCRGSIGRATVTAACTLVHMGWKPDAALKSIEAARGCTVPDTEEQRGWVLAYEALL